MDKSSFYLPFTIHDSRRRFFDGFALREQKAFYALRGEDEQVVHLFAREGRSLGSALTSYEATVACADDVHINRSARIFVVLKIQQGHAFDHAHADGCKLARDRMLLNPPVPQ